MNDELHRIFLVGIEVWRLDEEALDFIAVAHPSNQKDSSGDMATWESIGLIHAREWLRLFGQYGDGGRVVAVFRLPAEL